MCTSFNLSFGQALKINTNGNVGIGTSSPSVKFEVNYSDSYVKFTKTDGYGTSGFKFGPYYSRSSFDPLTSNTSDIGHYFWWYEAHITDIYSVHNLHVSDERYKENIKPLENALQTLLQLRGVRYDLKPEVFKTKNDSSFNPATIPLSNLKDNIGLIAQEVESILPEIVSYDSTRDIQCINYDELIPLLIEAIKEQQNKIEELTTLVLDNEGEKKSFSQPVEGITAFLGQNNPNPFNKETSIAYYLPETSSDASISIYNLSGSLIKNIYISGTGNNKVLIKASELEPGIYLYTLIADGKEVDTKRMILTE